MTCPIWSMLVVGNLLAPACFETEAGCRSAAEISSKVLAATSFCFNARETGLAVSAIVFRNGEEVDPNADEEDNNNIAK